MSKLARYSSWLPAAIFSVILAMNYSLTALANESQIINNSICMKCHKRNGNMRGVHANTALAIECQDCHGAKGKHPKKDSPVKGFSNKSLTPVVEQAGICLQCHDNEALSSADWTHNVHAYKVNCALCHQLHIEHDPMVGITELNRSQLCATCHHAE